jgi:hypothetical protein
MIASVPRRRGRNFRYIDKGAQVIVQGNRNGDGKGDFEILVKVWVRSAREIPTLVETNVCFRHVADIDTDVGDVCFRE